MQGNTAMVQLRVALIPGLNKLLVENAGSIEIEHTAKFIAYTPIPTPTCFTVQEYTHSIHVHKVWHTRTVDCMHMYFLKILRLLYSSSKQLLKKLSFGGLVFVLTAEINTLHKYKVHRAQIHCTTCTLYSNSNEYTQQLESVLWLNCSADSKITYCTCTILTAYVVPSFWYQMSHSVLWHVC